MSYCSLVFPLVHPTRGPSQISILAVVARVCNCVRAHCATLFLKGPGVLAVEAELVQARVRILLLDNVAPVDIRSLANPLRDRVRVAMLVIYLATSHEV